MSTFISNEWTRKLETNERLQQIGEMKQIIKTTLPLIKTVVNSVDLEALDRLNKLYETSETNFQMLQQKAKQAETDEERQNFDLLTISLLRDQAKICRLYHDYANQYIAKLDGANQLAK